MIHSNFIYSGFILFFLVQCMLSFQSFSFVFTEREEQVPFIIQIEFGKLVHECCPQHLRMRTTKIIIIVSFRKEFIRPSFSFVFTSASVCLPFLIGFSLCTVKKIKYVSVWLQEMWNSCKSIFTNNCACNSKNVIRQRNSKQEINEYEKM